MARSSGKANTAVDAQARGRPASWRLASPEQVHELAALRDLYEGLLPPRQREVVAMKLDEDLSLAEMAEHLGVSRQACEDALKRAEKALREIEGHVGLWERHLRELRCVGEAVAALSAMNGANWRESRDRALKWLESYRNGGEEPGGV